MNMSVSYVPFLKKLEECFDQHPFEKAQHAELLRSFSELPKAKKLEDIKALCSKVDALILKLEIFSSEMLVSYENDLVLKLDKEALKAKIETKRKEVYGLKQKLQDTQLLQTFQSGKTLSALKTNLDEVNSQYSKTSARDREADTELTILEEAYLNADNPLYVPLRYKVIEDSRYKITVLKKMLKHCQNQLFVALSEKF